MQDMMKNLMDDTWKRFGDMNSMNFMKDMDSTKIGLDVLSFQKNVFNNMYNATLQIQQQAEKMFEPLLKNMPVIPEEWNNLFKRTQEEIKKAVDEGFVKAESYFSTASNTAKEAEPAASETTKKKIDPAAK